MPGPCRSRRFRRWPVSWRHEGAMVASYPSLTLSVAPQGLRLFRGAPWLMALLIVSSLLLAAWSWWDSRSLKKEASQYELATARVEESTRRFIEEATRAG